MGIISELLKDLVGLNRERVESFPDPPEPMDEEPGPHPMDHFMDQGMEPTMNSNAEDDSDDAAADDGEVGEDDGEGGEDGDE